MASEDHVRPRRRGLVTTLVVVATLLAFLTINALWINRQALNTDNYAESSSQLLESDAIRSAISAYLVDEIYKSLDVEARIASALPPRAAALAGPAAGGLRSAADDGMNALLERPRVQALWEEANRAAHAHLLDVLEGNDKGNVSTAGGAVVLNLRPVLVDTAGRLGIDSGTVDKLPDNVAQLTVLKSDELGTVQDIFKFFRGLVIVLLVLTLGLYALAVFVAGRRREALRSVGFGFLVAGLAALVERRVGMDAALNSLADTASIKPAVKDLLTIQTSQLVETAGATVLYGIVFLFAAWLAGPTGWAVSSRQRLASYLADGRLAYGALVLIVFLIALWGPTPATRKPVAMLLLAGLMALGLEMLRRQTAREYPDAGPDRDALPPVPKGPSEVQPAAGGS